MFRRRYTFVLINPSTGLERRVTLPLYPCVAFVAVIGAMPALVGLGARWSASAELARLHGHNAVLSIENDSYRQATAELTAQIASLQASISELGDQAQIDETAQKALRQMPGVLPELRAPQRQAAGGAVGLASSLFAPEGTFGVLQDLLRVIEDRLSTVRTSVERQSAAAAAMPTIWPAHGWLSDGFGRRLDPFTGERDFHPALDISGNAGQPVYASADAVVRSAGYSGAYGKLVQLDHGFGLMTRYGHLSRLLVTPGDRVTRGQVIGHMGSTGRATGPHLHYEVWSNGQAVNPLRWLTR